jgi:uncharacterized protein (DUF1499 family)
MRLYRSALIMICIVGVFGGSGCAGSGSPDVGVADGRLKPCPSSPNCVSSQDDREDKNLPPIRYSGSKDQARSKLLSILRSMKRCEVVEQTDDYIHAVCTSAVFKFADDVEFLFDDEKRVIHFRSAARTGYYDFGVNRKRIEGIRSEFREG